MFARYLEVGTCSSRGSTVILTGVGSRKTPPDVLSQMTQIGEWCRETKTPLRSGHAAGADWAFEIGAQELCIAYLPWASFNKELSSLSRKVLYQETPESWNWVQQIHPAPERLGHGTRKLHGRNVWQVLGSKLTKPSNALVCWTPKGKTVGGTATAIILAQRFSIPVFNLASTDLDAVMERLSEIKSSENSYETGS